MLLLIQSRMQSFLIQDCDCILLKKYSPHVRSTLRQQFYKTIDFPKYKSTPEVEDLLESKDQISVVTSSAVFASIVMHAHIILCISNNGIIPIKISQSRPNCPILTVVTNAKLARVLTVYRNVLPTVCCIDHLSEAHYNDRIEVLLKHGIQLAKLLKLVSIGDLICFCFNSLEESDEQVTTFQSTFLSEEFVQN